MPIGCLSTVPHIVAHMYAHQPRRIWDLGIGMGFYGAAIRQWLNAGWQPNFRRTVLHGVEGFEAYRSKCWELYDRVDVVPIEDALAASQDVYDAIILADVIEHFDMDVGGKVVAACLERLAPGGCFYVATPAIFMEQGAAYGNEFERHRSLWTAADFHALASAHSQVCSRVEILQDGSPDVFGNLMLTGVFHRPSTTGSNS